MHSVLLSQLSAFGQAFLFILLGCFFILGGLATAWVVRPKRPNEEKLTSYECGEEPTGPAWGNFNIRFYIVALVFLLFEVEIVFLFPWATIFADKELIENTSGLWGWFSLAEMGIFIGLLVLGLVYAWAKGYLEWVRPKPRVTKHKGHVPDQIYEQLNQKSDSNTKEKAA